MTSDQKDPNLDVDRYLAGRLSETERTSFEERLTWDPQLLEDTILAEQLRDGLRATTDAMPIAARPRAGWSTVFAVAASFVGGIMLASLLFMNNEVEISSDAVPVTVQVLETFRGEADNLVSVHPDGLAILQVDVFNAGTRYAAEISDIAGNVVLHQADIPAGRDRRIAVAVPASVLAEGTYRVRIKDAATGNTEREISFKAQIAQP